jgi:hypothetical protein
VDEGLIHAWIDGAFEPGDSEGESIEAHIESCADCRARVKSALVLRERAVRVLRHTAPDAVRVEPFERIVEARRSRRATGEPAVGPARAVGAVPAGAGETGSGLEPARSGVSGRRRGAHFPLAWAASIMVAVSAGWFANNVIRQGDVRSTSEAELDQARVSSPASAPTVSTEEDRADTRAAAVNPNAAVLGSAVRDRDAADRQNAETQRSASAEEARRERVAADQARRERAADQAIQAAVPPSASLKVADTVLRDSISLRVAEAEQLESSAERNLLQFAAASEWTDVTMAEAAARFGRAPFMIEGVPIESIAIRATVGATVVRVRQRISPEASVEILQQAIPLSLDEVVVTGFRDDSTRVARADRLQRETGNRGVVLGSGALAAQLVVAAPQVAAGDTPAVAVPQLAYTVVLRGPLPVDSLRALAARVR